MGKGGQISETKLQQCWKLSKGIKSKNPQQSTGYNVELNNKNDKKLHEQLDNKTQTS